MINVTYVIKRLLNIKMSPTNIRLRAGEKSENGFATNENQTFFDSAGIDIPRKPIFVFGADVPTLDFSDSRRTRVNVCRKNGVRKKPTIPRRTDFIKIDSTNIPRREN